MAGGGQQRQTGWARRNKHLIAGAAVAAAASYVAYKAYNSKGLASTQATLLRAAETLQRLGAAAGAAGAVLEQVSADLRVFLESDSDEVPRSLRQLAKLARCPDVQDTIQACVGAAARGAAPPLADAALALTDRVLAAVLSERGSSLVALAVSVAAREGTGSLVASLRDAVSAALAAPAPGGGGTARHHHARRRGAAGDAAGEPPAGAALGGAAGAALVGALALLQSPPGERLMQSVISSGVGSAVGACLDSAAGVDLYGPMLAAFARTEHRQALTDLAAAMSGACCREMWAAFGAWPGDGGGAAGAGAWLDAARSPAARQQQRPAAGQQQELCPEGGGEAAAGQQVAAAAQVGSTPLVRSHSSSAASLEADGSPPSTPQSGPTTPEPSLLGAALTLRQPFSPMGLLRRRRGGAAAAASAAAQQAGAQAQPAPAAGQAAADGAAGPASWFVAFFAHASRHPEIRSLLLDMSASSTREFVRSLLPSFWTGRGGGAAGGGVGAAPGAWFERAPSAASVADMRMRLQHTQALVFVAVMMALYALTPRVMLLPGTA
ncbi:MAG: hypothetical protein J3K34DRAFT_522775 [Monoraphidium minutum]|nr:MAG: hypothetical protein J3K34DRAFT_522775 [Monoraphidium minutum]